MGKIRTKLSLSLFSLGIFLIFGFLAVEKTTFGKDSTQLETLFSVVFFSFCYTLFAGTFYACVVWTSCCDNQNQQVSNLPLESRQREPPTLPLFAPRTERALPLLDGSVTSHSIS